jgi:aminoglycoside N3'-acetyltransferase
MSYIHALEEEANSPYALTKSPVRYKTVDKDGRLCEKEYYKHNFRRTQAPVLQKYAKCLELLKEGDGYTAGEVHGAKSYLIDARAFHDAALSRMKRERCRCHDSEDNYSR